MRFNRSLTAAIRFSFPAVLGLLLLACTGGGASPSPSAPTDAGGSGSCQTSGEVSAPNLLANAGLEQGPEPWITLDPETGFQVSTAQAHTGSNSALLQMRDSADEVDEDGSKVYYLVQEITPDEMPEVICGFYRVENWLKGSRHQYLQAVAIAFTPSNFPSQEAGGFPNYQVRFLLAGADSPPFNINNGKFVFVTRDDPVQGQWVPFELRLRDSFEELWGKVPEGFEKLRLLFEVRWDNKVAGEGPAQADAYYDDLYAGNG